MFKEIFKYTPSSHFDRILFIVFYGKIISIFLPLEFNSQEFRENFKIIHNFVLIILLFVWVVLELNKPNSGMKWWTFLILIIPLSFIIFLICFFVLLIPCITEEGREIYKEKNGSGKIVERRLNCGATTDYDDSIYYIKPITPLFNFIWKTDTLAIDKNKYQRL
jgi:hypothetical protein